MLPNGKQIDFINTSCATSYVRPRTGRETIRNIHKHSKLSVCVHIAPTLLLGPLPSRIFAIPEKYIFYKSTNKSVLPAAEILILLDIVRLETDAEEMIPQLAFVTLDPVNLSIRFSLEQKSRRYFTCFPVGLLHLGLTAEQSSSPSSRSFSA